MDFGRGSQITSYKPESVGAPQTLSQNGLSVMPANRDDHGIWINIAQTSSVCNALASCTVLRAFWCAAVADSTSHAVGPWSETPTVAPHHQRQCLSLLHNVCVTPLTFQDATLPAVPLLADLKFLKRTSTSNANVGGCSITSAISAPSKACLAEENSPTWMRLNARTNLFFFHQLYGSVKVRSPMWPTGAHCGGLRLPAAVRFPGWTPVVRCGSGCLYCCC